MVVTKVKEVAETYFYDRPSMVVSKVKEVAEAYFGGTAGKGRACLLL